MLLDASADQMHYLDKLAAVSIALACDLDLRSELELRPE